MSKLGILLGAGASFPFGIPMMREFYTRFCTYIQHSRKHCYPLIERLTKDAVGQVDLEYLIQQLELVRAIRDGMRVLGESAGAVDQALSLADELRGYLDMFLIETCESFDAKRVSATLGKLVSFAAEKEAFVFTTNYDRLFEVAAASIGVWCADGFEQPLSLPECHWSGKFSGGLRLIKLHGSVNWYEEEGAENLFRLERGFSLPSHEYRLTHGDRALRPLMIIPTLEKAILKPPYTSLLTQFSDALREIEILIVIGNSLRDDHLRGLILERADNLDIVLVNPAAADQVNVLRRPESTHAIATGVEEFIGFGLGDLGKVLIDLEQVREERTERRRELLATYAREVSLAVAQLASADYSEAVQDQLTRLGSERAEMRLGALKSLSRPTHPSVLKLIRDLALRDIDEGVRVAAVDALVDIEGLSAAEILGRVAREPGPLLVRAEAALALRSFADSAVAREEYGKLMTAVSGEQQMMKFLASDLDGGVTN